jgi:hypothetical protein
MVISERHHLGVVTGKRATHRAFLEENVTKFDTVLEYRCFFQIYYLIRTTDE